MTNVNWEKPRTADEKEFGRLRAIVGANKFLPIIRLITRRPSSNLPAHTNIFKVRRLHKYFQSLPMRFSSQFLTEFLIAQYFHFWYLSTYCYRGLKSDYIAKDFMLFETSPRQCI